MKKRPGISKLRHRIEVCSAMDDIQNGQILLERKSIFTAWAAINAAKASFFGKDGFGIKESRDTETHVVMMRYRSDINISSAAWLYEERRKSSPRWYKILGVEDYCEDAIYWKFKCRLVERSDDAVRPTQDAPEKPKSTPVRAVPLPSGVRL
jgi:hypothetical protein